MKGWIIALICVAIVIVGILISSAVKVIMKKTVEKKGKEFNTGKYEYLYATLSFILSATGIFCFLKFYLKVTDVTDLIKTTSLYAGCGQTIYLFVVQLVRKGVVGAFSSIKNLIDRLKLSKNPVAELPEMIAEEVNSEDEVRETKVEKKELDNLSNELIKFINGKSK